MPRGVPAAKTPGTAIASRQCSFPMVLENFESFVSLCEMLAKSGKCGEMRTKESILAVAIKGAELGLPPMTAVDSIYVFGGKLTLSYSLAQSLVYRDFPGAKFEIENGSDFCAVRLTVPGRESYLAKFSMEDAKKADLLSKDNWKKNPKAMLRARAIAEACRVVCPDSLAGMYCTEEISDVNIGSPIDVTANATVTAAPSNAPEPETNGTASATMAHKSEIVDEPAKAAPAARPAGGMRMAAKPAETSAAAKATTPSANGNGHATNGNGHSNGTSAAPTGGANAANLAQLNALKTLKESLKVPNPEWLAMVGHFKAGATSVRELSIDQANKMIGMLRQRQEAKEKTGYSQSIDEINDPATVNASAAEPEMAGATPPN